MADNDNHQDTVKSDEEDGEDGHNSDEDGDVHFLDLDEDDEDSEENSDEHDSEEGYGEKEYNTENYQFTLLRAPKPLLTLKLYVTKDPEFKDWLQQVHVSCTYNGIVIGTALGQHIDRNYIRSFFYRDMEEPTRDMSSLAYEIFDRYGFLKKELKEHPVRKGTGAWASELDFGKLLLIEYIKLDKEWHRQGIGSTMAKALIQMAGNLKGGIGFSLTIPGWLNTKDMDYELNGKSKSEVRAMHSHQLNVAVAFFRSLGFRRIGASGCFGLAEDPAHKAHNVSATDDYDPEEAPLDMDDDSDEEDGNPFTLEQRLEEKMLKRMQIELPLHHVVTTLSDAECVASFKAHIDANDVAEAEWRRVDDSRNNILHIAAIFSKPAIIRWLTENIDKDKTLRLARNIKGHTPLEALQTVLESSRISREYGTMTVCISDKFRGFPQPDVDCLGILQGYPDVSGTRALRLQYGCTCGECLAGFMSPRMKFALLAEAEITHDMLSSGIDGDYWCDMSGHLTNHVALALTRNFQTNKSLRKGFANMFDHIAACLRQNSIPTEANILEAWRNASEWPPVTRNFLEKGGNVENALRVVFDVARDQDYKAGDGETMAVFSDDILKLPECRNDHEFGFVALACGLQEKHPPSLFD